MSDLEHRRRNQPWVWTQDEDERLKALVAQGASVVKVAAALKRRIISVQLAPVRLAVRSRRYGSSDRSGPIHRTTSDAEKDALAAAR
jgi:hypothetical protein